MHRSLIREALHCISNERDFVWISPGTGNLVQHGGQQLQRDVLKCDQNVSKLAILRKNLHSMVAQKLLSQCFNNHQPDQNHWENTDLITIFLTLLSHSDDDDVD